MSVPTLAPAPTASGEPRPLALSAKLLYGIGEMPITMLMVLQGYFILFFYERVMGLPSVIVGVALFATLALDAITDPWIGHLSDGSRARLGRRHAFMLPGAIGMGPAFVLLFTPPRTLSHTGLILWLICAMVALRATSAIYRIPYLGLGAELSKGYDDRTSTMAIRAVFGLLGTLCAAGLSFLVFFPATADGSEPKLNYAGYPRMSLAFGALMTITGLISFFGTLRYRTIGAGKSAEVPSFFSAFRIAMENADFRKIWGASTTFFLAVTLNFAANIYYFTWYARITGGTLGQVQVSFYIGALAGVILWMALAKRTEKRTLGIAAMAGLAVVLVLATLLVGEGHLFGTGRVVPVMFGCIVGGLFASAVWVIPPSMVADVTDTDTLRTGLRREGIFFGISNFGEKMAGGGALLLAGALLAVGRKISHAAVDGAPADPIYLGMMYGVVPAVILLVSVGFLMRYRLDRRTVHDIQQQLAQRGSTAGN